MMKRLVVVGIVLAGCGKGDGEKKDPEQKGITVGGDKATVTPPAARPIGLEQVAAWNYLYGKGDKDFSLAEDARKKKDWPAVQAACEAALVKDPGHLDAHYLAAIALSMQGKHDAVGEHLEAALAGDWMQFGRTFEKEEGLSAFLATPQGQKVREYSTAVKDELLRRVKGGVWMVGRRSGFKGPDKPGPQFASSRAELYAYDAETNRFLRITTTGHKLMTYLRSPSGDELAYASYSKVDTAATPVRLVEARVGTINLLALDAPAKDAKIKDVEGVTLWYRAGDELLVTAGGKTYAVDKTGGVLKEAQAEREGASVTATYAYVEAEREAAPGVEADFAAATGAAASFVIQSSKKTINLPKGEAALRSSFVWSPSGARAAFATWADPCSPNAPERLSALYVVEAATGKLKHLYKADGVREARWLDDDKLLYEDEKQGLRLYDAAQSREVTRLATRGGLDLTGLGAVAGSVCRQAPPPPPEPGIDDVPSDGVIPSDE